MVLERYREKGKIGAKDIPILVDHQEWVSLFGKSNDPRLMYCCFMLRKMLRKKEKIEREIVQIKKDKKKHMDRIIKLSQEINNEGNEDAIEEMEEVQGSVLNLIKKLDQLEERHYILKERIRNINIRLLECTVQAAYRTIRKQERIVERTADRIEYLKAQLNQAIDRKHSIEDRKTRIYRLIHSFLGSEETNKLDESLLEG